MYDYIVAVALLSGAISPQEGNKDFFNKYRFHMQNLAVELELLDPREVRYVFVRSEEFLSDLSLLQRNYMDLSDAPFCSGSDTFPDRTIINEYLAFNRSYRQYVAARLVPSKESQVKEQLQKIDRLYFIWDTVRDAKCEYYYVGVRRKALKNLKEMVGEERYYSGMLPAYVPLEDFNYIGE